MCFIAFEHITFNVNVLSLIIVIYFYKALYS